METDIEIPNHILESIIYEELSCPICLDTLNSTMVTECLHRFCNSCIAKFIRQLDAETMRECPLCRVAITSTRNLRKDESMDQLVSVLLRFASVGNSSTESNTSNIVQNAAQMHRKRTRDMVEKLKDKRQQIKSLVSQESKEKHLIHLSQAISNTKTLKSSSFSRSKQNENSSNSKNINKKPTKLDLIDDLYQNLHIDHTDESQTNHFQYLDTLYLFQVILHPLETFLQPLKHLYLQCKGSVCIETIKKIICKSNPDVSILDIEISISLPNRDYENENNCNLSIEYIISNNTKICDVFQYISNNCQDRTHIPVLLYSFQSKETKRKL